MNLGQADLLCLINNLFLLQHELVSLHARHAVFLQSNSYQFHTRREGLRHRIMVSVRHTVKFHLVVFNE